MAENIDDLMCEFYYNIDNNTLAFAAPNNLYKFLKEKGYKISKEQLTDLTRQKTYTLHKPRQNRFIRCKYNITNIDDLWEADLIDMQSYSRKNSGNKYILAVIDCFSKFAWCIPIKRKIPSEIVRAFEIIFASTERRPLCVQTDKGKEFDNKSFRSFLSCKSILFQTTRDPVTKAAICERFIRTIKSIIFKYFTFKNTSRYIDVIKALVYVYNNRKHSTIGVPPSAVNETNILEIWRYMNRNTERIASIPNFITGDMVRIANPKKVFDKGYKQAWSHEVFKIIKIVNKQPCVYRLQDSDGTTIKGNFYSCEIQKVGIPTQA